MSRAEARLILNQAEVEEMDPEHIMDVSKTQNLATRICV